MSSSSSVCADCKDDSAWRRSECSFSSEDWRERSVGLDCGVLNGLGGLEKDVLRGDVSSVGKGGACPLGRLGVEELYCGDAPMPRPVVTEGDNVLWAGVVGVRLRLRLLAPSEGRFRERKEEREERRPAGMGVPEEVLGREESSSGVVMGVEELGRGRCSWVRR